MFDMQLLSSRQFILSTSTSTNNSSPTLSPASTMALEFKRNQKDAEARVAANNKFLQDKGIKAVFSIDWDAIGKDANKGNVSKWCTYESQFNPCRDMELVFKDDIGKEAFNEAFDKI